MMIYVVIHEHWNYRALALNYAVKGVFSNEALAKERVKYLVEAGGNIYSEDNWSGNKYYDIAKYHKLDTYSIEYFDLDK